MHVIEPLMDVGFVAMQGRDGVAADPKMRIGKPHGSVLEKPIERRACRGKIVAWWHRMGTGHRMVPTAERVSGEQRARSVLDEAQMVACMPGAGDDLDLHPMTSIAPLAVMCGHQLVAGDREGTTVVGRQLRRGGLHSVEEMRRIGEMLHTGWVNPDATRRVRVG